MDKLKQLVASKRKAAEEEFRGKKYAKRADIEAARLQKLKEEEKLEMQEKEKKRLEKERLKYMDDSRISSVDSRDRKYSTVAKSADGVLSLTETERGYKGSQSPSKQRPGSEEPEMLEEELSVKEVIRRLRVLGEPATLFGETEKERRSRLSKAEREVLLEDEAAGGQQSNIHLEIQRQEKERALSRAWQQHEEPSAGKSSNIGTRNILNGTYFDSTTKFGDSKDVSRANINTETALIPSTSSAGQEDETQKLMASFQAAAEALAEKSMPVEERVSKWLRRWMHEWREDIESRSEKERATPSGRQAELRFKETEQYFRPLYARLRSRSLDPQLLAGIKLMIDCMKDRNYLQAYKIYMGVAIGNSPWPIGVTHVGLHERSAREKISFKYASGSAHIMNDEATRKFIQALKRLMTYVQKRYPTDPSRSVDFDGGEDGSERIASVVAASKGENAPVPAPHLLDEHGSVRVPTRWGAMIKDTLKEVTEQDAKEYQ